MGEKYFPRLQQVISADGQKRSLRPGSHDTTIHVGLILRRWQWLLLSSAEGNGGKENSENPKNITDCPVENFPAQTEDENSCFLTTLFWLLHTNMGYESKYRHFFNVSKFQKYKNTFIPHRNLALVSGLFFISLLPRWRQTAIEMASSW